MMRGYAERWYRGAGKCGKILPGIKSVDFEVVAYSPDV